MQTAMRFVFMPMITVGRIHLHPPRLRPPSCPHCYHEFLLQQQENYNLNLYREIMAMKFTWTPPGYNLLKLNTDGSSKGNPGPSSFGGLIRDSKGIWVCGYIGKMKGRSYTSLEAEVWSIFKGLCLIKKKNISEVLIETDCQGVLMLGVQGFDKFKDHDHHWLKSVMGVMNKIMIEQRCTMIHTRRDGNHCADQLAKLGGRQLEEYVDLEEPPVQLIPHLLGDIEAAALESESND